MRDLFDLVIVRYHFIRRSRLHVRVRVERGGREARPLLPVARFDEDVEFPEGEPAVVGAEPPAPCGSGEELEPPSSLFSRIVSRSSRARIDASTAFLTISSSRFDDSSSRLRDLFSIPAIAGSGKKSAYSSRSALWAS